MWETFISWYINTYLGRYVENLNSQQLTFALGQGELELENVPLKKNVFRSWGLPVEVKASVVGRIKIEFNLLKYFRNEPVLVTIEDVYVVAGPLNLAEWDPVEEELLAHDGKMNSLDSHEARWKAQFDISNEASYYSSLYFSSMRIGASIVTKVVENLQLNVRNVHIRFEEELGMLDRVVAFGVTLECLTAQSCDSSWNALSSSMSNATECSFKTLQLSKFGVYCDTKGERCSKMTPAELKIAMSGFQTSKHEYLLCPVSAEARIAKNNSASSLSSTSKPRFDVHLVLDKVPLQLTDSQYRNSLRTYKAFMQLERHCRLRHYRPFCPVKGHVPQWWFYAYRAVLALKGYRRRRQLKTIDEVLQRARDNVGYVKAYEQHLNGDLVTVEARQLKDRIEAELHYDEIIDLREIVMVRMEKCGNVTGAATTAPKEKSPNGGGGNVPVEFSSQIPSSSSGQQGRYGIMSWLFPSWNVQVPETSIAEVDSKPPEINSVPGGVESDVLLSTSVRQSESDFDEAILGDVKAFGRDALLARFSFKLDKGTVSLLRKSLPFLEFDFTGVEVLAALKPRTGSHKFQMTLSTVSLKDCRTKQLIVTPHHVPGSSKVSHFPSLSPRPKDPRSGESLFSLSYEKRPHKKAGHKISMTTRPLDLILNPELYEDVQKFFHLKDIDEDLIVHQSRYEMMKQKTKEELKIYWERLVDQHASANPANTSNWEIYLDISAPQIIIFGSKYISENSKGRQARTQNRMDGRFSNRALGSPHSASSGSFVVIDLGRFRFTNVKAEDGITSPEPSSYKENETENSITDDEDEEFLTPCSSPLPEAQEASHVTSPGASLVGNPDYLRRISLENGMPGDTLESFYSKLYKNYSLEITDIHVIVVESKSSRDVNWRAASSKNTSPMHLVDKFSVDVQLERRLVYSEDPMWPALTTIATLPKLTFHVNESKVNTVRSVIGAYFAAKTLPTQESRGDLSFLNQSVMNLQEAETSYYQAKDVHQKGVSDSSSRASSRLIVAQFTVQHVSVDIQSRERNIAELQILGARTILSKRHENTEITFVIQSLLLADAVQTFGPDFQLLLASHKHVCMDTVSGSLRDSEPTSPMSPQPPASPLPQTSQKMAASLTMPAQLHEALLASLRSKWKKQALSMDSHSPMLDTDALISADLTLTKKDEDMAILNVQFNNLDVIANQETWVEILQFLQRLKPTSTEEERQEADTEATQSVTPENEKSSQRLQANFEFRRLNVLLLRGVVGKDGDECARKIATATASDSKINLVLSKGMLTVDGSLGGLQMLNLTPEGQRHQRVLSVGQDPLIDPTYQPFVLGEELPVPGSNESALTFSYEKQVSKSHSSPPPRLTLKMASVIYTHCPVFLVDLKKCISQFQEPLTMKLKSAAAQIALGLVRQDAIPGLNFRSSSNSLSGSLEKLDFEDEHLMMYPDTSRSSKSSLKVDIVLDSPVIVLPRNRNSPEVLVANLGQISVVGNNNIEGSTIFPGGGDMIERGDGEIVGYNIFICDISLYSLNLTDRWRMVDSLKMTYPTASSTTLMRAQELYQCDHESATPILHNTVIHLTISYVDEASPVGHAGDYRATTDFGRNAQQLLIQGRVISALKVSLTPKQYAQVLDSLGNIASNEEDLGTNEVSVTERRVNWQKEVGHLRGRMKDPLPLPLPSPTHYADESLPIKTSFEISELIVELALPAQTLASHKVAAVDVPHLTLSCSELTFHCDKRSHKMEMDICLKALKLEDTSVTVDSPRRVLASSKPGSGNLSGKPKVNSAYALYSGVISKSCPNLQLSAPLQVAESPSFNNEIGVRLDSASLPDELDPGMIFSGRYHPNGVSFKPLRSNRSRRASTKRANQSQSTAEHCPVTPPPSPRPEDGFWDNLVHIKMVFIDQKSPDFITKFAGTHKHTRVDFNILEVLLIPETFSCLRQFFSDASKHGSTNTQVQTIPTPHQTSASPGPPNADFMEQQQKNSETVINVRALLVKVGRTSGPLAEAEVNDVHCELKSRGLNYFGVDGRLGSLEIRDISKFAGLYPLKFVFQGDQALDFDYVRVGSDGKFRLKMSSIVCVHTNRFYSEFTNLWSSLFGSGSNEIETPVTDRNKSEFSHEMPVESVKVTLDIQAGAPVIILPHSAMSETLLIVDLGHLSVKNKFVEEAPGIVLNITSIDLIEMDLYSGYLDQFTYDCSNEELEKCWKLHQGTAIVKSRGNSSFLNTKCALNLKMRRYFTGVTPESQAVTLIHGTLSTVHCTINSEKYKLVRGLLQFNIGEHIEMDPGVAPNREHLPRSSSVRSRLDLGIELELVNVILEVLKDEDSHLSRIDFLKSKFTFQSNSDGTKDVDLASQEILICDIRRDGVPVEIKGQDGNSKCAKNCFKNILQQSGSYSTSQFQTHLSSQSSSSFFQAKVPLQAEIHYRQTQKGTNVTIVLNNMRLMLILDWWMEVLSFLGQKLEPPKPHPHQKVVCESESQAIQRNISPVLERSRELSAPITVSSGIVTKRAPVLDIPESTFELKMNVSSCELVLVEDPAIWDSNAIILKSTAMLGYRPHLERPISCSLLECELFSCILGLESETALSILDPTNIQIELVRQSYTESQGIMDATLSLSACAKILKVQSPNLNLRLSYYDMKMFVKFLERFSKEAKTHFQRRRDSELGGADHRTYSEGEMYGIVNHGIDLELAEDALLSFQEYDSDVGRSTPRSIPPLSLTRSQTEHEDAPSIYGIDVKCNLFSLCVIDDCKDADVPLLEVGVQSLELNQNCVDNIGTAECVLSGDYYNRALSGWEPFLEPWKCSISWQKNLIGKLGAYSPNSEFPSKAPELELSIHSRKSLDVNITSTLLSLYRTVSSNWSEDYQLQKQDKRRAPFVPFALRNETGSPLWFRTILSENDVIVRERERTKSTDEFSDRTGWIQVNHLTVQPFSFEGRVKLRHRNTHQLRTHQLAVRVDGWQEVTPVSVDKVGTYFRIANPVMQRRYGLYTELPPTRLVFEVSLEGSAQKLVIVRSALQVKNSLTDPIELKLENTIVYPSFERAQTGGSFIAQIAPGNVYPVPLHSVWAHMWVRPLIPDGALSSQYTYCTKALLVTNASQENHLSGLRECTSVTSEEQQCYRFCVAVKRDDFPADDDHIIPQNTLPSLAQLMSMSKRANLITLKSPLKISNLLPHEITFEIRSIGLSGHILPGKDCDMTNVDTSEQFEIVFTTETFSQTSPLTINPSVTGVAARLKMVDAQKRIIFLTARVRRGEGGTLTIGLCCPLWVINKSGLPIVCKQEGASAEAAGQFNEHEVGRMVTPLLFSFADQETSETMSLRVGNGIHKGSKPYWCRAFLCQNGTRVRKLSVSHSNNRPESVYTVGVEVKSGSGRYRDTKLVLISPRFVVDNRSSRRVQISQRVYATSFFDAAAQATHLTLPSDCNLPFHWPRLDRDQLLCIKFVDIDNGIWSGGFPIDNVDSFHVNIRDRDGNCTFLRIEIVLQGSTYFIVLNDTEQLPPPFRVDNLAFVPITFHQACVGEERLKLTAKGESSLPYALDEPTQPAHLTLEAPGGTSVIVNMDVLGSGACITYENFFYIALTATFPPEEDGNVIVGMGMEALHLVLEVASGSQKVTLAKKEPGKLSQLWRVNVDGLIEHEGSRPIGDPKQTDPGSRLVLDIAGSAPQPSQCVALMLRRSDKRRASTQHWEFTNDGRLKLSMYANMYVQAKDGFGLGGVSYEVDSEESNGASWKLWSDIVLGPPQPVCYIRTATGIHAEQAVCRQKLRGGSGKLTLEVLTDGPTRVVRISDEDIPPRIHLLRHTFESSNYNTAPKFRVKVELLDGLGISIINCNPREELVYCKLSNMIVEWTESKESQIVKATVENLQIDNQLHESEKTGVVYVTASERVELVDEHNGYEPLPVLRLAWESMKSKLNAHVFKYWELGIKPLSVILEERLLLKLCNWLDVGRNTQSFDGLRESDFEVQKAFTNTASLTAKRFYFGMLKIVLSQVRLSVLTTSKLPPELSVVKRRLGLTLIRFEDAIVDLDEFIKFHPFETFEFLLAMVIKHYRDELMSQAAVILGSTDFLGNPLGFVNDVSVGVSGLIYEGSMLSLVKNVTHGISNSAAKVTGSLGEALGGRTILDERHEEERRRIKDEHSGNSAEHLYAGLKGFGHGFIGGITSIATQSYEGLSNDGMTGLITGIGKGLVGTVTKPAVGILDLASGAASAIRDSSQTSSRLVPLRARPTRVVIGNGGLLPPYSEVSARGQELLFEVNDRNYKELYIGFESLKSGLNNDLRIMISSEAVTVFRPGKGNPAILKVPLSDLSECRIAELRDENYEKNTYIEFVRQIRDAQVGAPTCRPQVMCENEQVAKRVVQQVNYAKVLYEELRHSQKENTNSNSDD